MLDKKYLVCILGSRDPSIHTPESSHDFQILKKIG